MALGWRGQYYRYREFYNSLLVLYKQREDVQAFLEIILSLSTIIVFVLFALKPTALTMISLNNEIEEKKEMLASLNQKINNLQIANSVFSQNQTAVDNINTAIFTKPQPSTLSSQILGLAAKNSVSVLGISIGQVVVAGAGGSVKEIDNLKPLPTNAKPMQISISVKGSYANLMQYAKDLENLRIPIKIDSLTINSTQVEGGSAIVELITGRVPYLD
jgi:hypothetical protein